MKTSLNPSTVARSPFYSQGVDVTASRLVFVSGQVGVTADGAPLDGVEAQTRQAIANVAAVLAEAGLTPSSIVKQTIYLTDPADVAGFLAGASEFVTDDPPATTMLIVAALADPSLRVEIEVTAAG